MRRNARSPIDIDAVLAKHWRVVTPGRHPDNDPLDPDTPRMQRSVLTAWVIRFPVSGSGLRPGRF